MYWYVRVLTDLIGRKDSDCKWNCRFYSGVRDLSKTEKKPKQLDLVGLINLVFPALFGKDLTISTCISFASTVFNKDLTIWPLPAIRRKSKNKNNLFQHDGQTSAPPSGSRGCQGTFQYEVGCDQFHSNLVSSLEEQWADLLPSVSCDVHFWRKASSEPSLDLPWRSRVLSIQILAFF